MLSKIDLAALRCMAKLTEGKSLQLYSSTLLELVDRIEFLEARQTELQEEGTKLVTERRELKAALVKRASQKEGL